MSINDTKEYFGKSYMAVEYNGKPSDFMPSDFMPSDDDPQCKICAVEPNYCGMCDECHGDIPFVFVKTDYAKAMETVMQFYKH
jgi:hypothetical protein